MTSSIPNRDLLMAAVHGLRLVPLESILCSEELRQRASRTPDPSGDAEAQERLAQGLADAPHAALQSVADMVLERLRAGSAGVSVLSDDRSTFHWTAISGRWREHAGKTSPRDFGPGGDVLDRDGPLAFTHPERRYTYLASLAPEMSELLMVPFHVDGRAMGVLWAAQHEEIGRDGFDLEDLRRLSLLGACGSAGYRALRLVTHPGSDAAPAPAEPAPSGPVWRGDGGRAHRRAALNLLEDAVQARHTVERLNQELRESEAQLAIELAATQQLQSASALLVDGDPDALYRKLVDATIAIMQSDMANLQTLDEEQNALRLLAWRGFDASFASRFELSRPGSATACSAAWQRRERVIVPDVETCEFMAGTSELEDLRAAGVRSVQSTPLFTRGGRLVGVISSHWRTPHDPRASDLRAFDILARQAADLIERKASEEAIGRLAAIVTSSSDAIIGKDLNGVITSWNLGAQHLFGYTADEAVGKSITMLIPEDRAGEETGILQRIHRGERIEHFETIRRHKDGTLLDISITVSPIWDTLGRIIGAAKIARDVSQRKRNEAALQEADRRKNEFLAVLAHELRGPLAPIRNGMQIIHLRSGDPETVVSAGAMVERQVDHMTRLVDDLMDINRISRGKLELRRQPLELVTLTKDVLQAMRGSFEITRHHLTLTAPAEPIHVNADATRLSQVIGNLLHNAQKFTDGGGRIDVMIESGESQVVIRVRDSGIGIEAGDLPSLFDMFSQVNHSRDRSRGGLGIGLSLVRSIVEMHGGMVDVRSAGIGRGSEFTLRLPTLDHRTPPARSQPSPAPESGPLRILAVDDNRDSVESLAMLLRMGGHEVQVAHDGLEAVEQAAHFQPEVVLLDLGLPRIDGYEAARRIRNQPGGAHTGLVAVSGWGQDEDRARSRQAGFDAHLVKPVDPDVLNRVLATVVPRAR